MINKSFYKIVIIGGGYAGLRLVSNLGNYKKNNKFYKLLLIDNNRYYMCKPLLHMIASRSINSFINLVNYDNFSKKNNFEFELGNLININRLNKTILLDNVYSENNSDILIKKRYISYDLLVISIGSITNDFGISGVNKYCLKLDNFYQSKICLNKINDILIKLKFNINLNNINILIIGAGATGVEISTEIKNLVNNLNFKNKIKIILVESSDRILPTFSKNFSFNINNELEKIGINVLLNTRVIKVCKKGIFTNENNFIKSDLIIWTTGIKVDDNIRNISDLEINNVNQFKILPNLRTTLDSCIFAIGDCSYFNFNNLIVPPRAQAAKQMADHMFKNIKLIIEKKNINNFYYNDKGTLITLSKFNTFGFINIKTFNKKIYIKGIIAKIFYIFLYRSYQMSLYGFFKTILIIITEYLLKILNIY